MNKAHQTYISNLRFGRLSKFLSKLETSKISSDFEKRQKELEKYYKKDEDEVLAEKTENLLNKANDGINLTNDEVVFLNENAYKPKGFEFDKNGKLIQQK